MFFRPPRKRRKPLSLQQKNPPALGLLELMVAIALFSVFSVILIQSTIGGRFAQANSQDRLQARYLAVEGLEAVRSIRDFAWPFFAVEGTHGLDFETNGFWEYSGFEDTHSNGRFTRSVEIEAISVNLYRATVEVSWLTFEGRPQVFRTQSYFFDNQVLESFLLTSEADFEMGFFNSTRANGGQLELGTWTGDFSPLIDGLDVNSTLPRDIYIRDNLLFYGTSVSASYGEFFVFDLKDVSQDGVSSSPVQSLEIGHAVNDIVVDDTNSFAYVGNTNNDAELLLVDLSDYSTVEVNLPLFTDVEALAIHEEFLALGTTVSSGSEILLYQFFVPTAPTAISLDIDVGANVNQVANYENIAFFVTEANDAELVIVDMTAEAVNTYVKVDFTGPVNMTSVTVDAENQRLYLGRANGFVYECDISMPDLLENDWSDVGIDECATAVDAGNSIEDMFVNGDFLFTIQGSTSGQVVTFDLPGLSNLQRDDLIGSFNGEAVWFNGIHLYAAGYNTSAELQVFDPNVNPWAVPNEDEAIYVDGGSSCLCEGPEGVYLVGRNLVVLGGNTGDQFQISEDGSQWKVQADGGGWNEEEWYDKSDVDVIYVFGGNGADQIQFSSVDIPTFIYGGNGADQIQGSDGVDTIYGGRGVDDIQANGGDDIIYGGSGSDDIDGGSGSNTIIEGGDEGDCSCEPDPGGGGSAPVDVDDMRAIYQSGDYVYFTRLYHSSGTCASDDPDSCEFLIMDSQADTFLGGVDVPANVYGVYVSGDYAYLTTSHNSREIYIVDVSDPSAPFVHDYQNLDRADDLFGITGYGNYIYMGRNDRNISGPVECVTSDGEGCELIVGDISTPGFVDLSTTTSLDIVNTGGGSSVLDVKVNGDGTQLFVLNEGSNKELMIYDISTNPGAPDFVSQENNSGSKNPTAGFYDDENDIMHLGFSTGEYVTYNPSTDSFTTHFDVGSGEIWDLKLIPSQDLLVLATGVSNKQFTFVDISNISSPSEMSSYDPGAGDIFALTYDADLNRIYGAANDEPGIVILSSNSVATLIADSGLYTSPVWDTEVPGPLYISMDCTLGAASDGSVLLFVRSNSTEAGVLSEAWLPSQGLACAEDVDLTTISGFANRQYVQVQARFTAGSLTPIIEDVSLNYYD